MSYNFDFNDRMLERSDARENNSYVRPTAPALPSQPYVAPATTPVMMDTAVMPTGMPTPEEIQAAIAAMGTGMPTPEQVQTALAAMETVPPGVAASAAANAPVTTAPLTTPNNPILDERQLEQMYDRDEMPTEQEIAEAIAAATGGGQPTTDETVLDEDMVIGGAMATPYYNPATGETFLQTNTAQAVPEGFIPGSPPETGTGDGTETTEPDFMTELEAMIAAMQAEGTASAEAQAAAQAAGQEQFNAASQNYVVGGSAMGYNPYMSGQYQSNPYGNAGVPDMGGITSIPVPAPLQNFEQPQDQPTAMETFNAGYQSPRTTTSI